MAVDNSKFLGTASKGDANNSTNNVVSIGLNIAISDTRNTGPDFAKTIELLAEALKNPDTIVERLTDQINSAAARKSDIILDAEMGHIPEQSQLNQVEISRMAALGVLKDATPEELVVAYAARLLNQTPTAVDLSKVMALAVEPVKNVKQKKPSAKTSKGMRG